jgi:hypothetical protein
VRLRWHFRQVLHTRDESISVTGYGDDEVVLVGPLAKRSSERRYLTRQIVLIDGDVRPHTVQELIFADRPVSMFEHYDEHVERFGRDRYQTTFPPQTFRSLKGSDLDRPPVGVSHRATATFQFFSTLFRTFGIDTASRRG